MRQKEYLQFKVSEATKEKITIVASDETLDRYGEVVPLDAWDFKNYKKNPVLLVDHDYKVSNIVGRAKNLKVSKDSFTFEPEFHGTTQLAQEVSRMVDEGWLPAVSVGFMPHGPKKDGEKGINELLEISFVAVGANPNALALAMKSIDAKQEKKVFDWAMTKDSEILELQRIEFAKKNFATDQEVRTWLASHDFNSTDITDEKDVFVAKQFDVKACGEEVTEIKFNDEGVTGYACRAKTVQDSVDQDKTKDELISQVASLSEQIIEMKDGRVLSGKTRNKIQEGVTALKQAVTVLEELLVATDPNAEKATDYTSNGRDPVEQQETIAPKKASLSVVGVLQRINKDSNILLRELKK